MMSTVSKIARTSLAPKVTWTRITPTPDPDFGSPCARSSHGLSFLPEQNRLVLLGGEHIARTPIDDGAHWIADLVEGTWAWRRLTVTSSSDLSPSPRIAHAQAVYQNCVYIFGGRAGVAMEEQALNDLWRLDCSGPRGSETWSRVEANGASPEARSFHRMVCVGSNLYVFGGCGAAGRLADLHRFDLNSTTWYALGVSKLRGRGGANLLPLAGGTQVGAVAGFAGEETVDGHVYDIASETWTEELLQLNEMRPRSVCVSGSFPALGYSVIFGGEVDPSDRGHEGAGSFEKDLVVLDEEDGSFHSSIPPDSTTGEWPTARGWSDGSATETENGEGLLYIFGGLAGDDENPERLDDLWVLKIEK